jgi:hypothetical protein
MASVEERVSFLEGQVVLLPQMIDALHADVRSLRTEMNSGLDSLRTEMHRGLDSVRGEMNSGVISVRAEMTQLGRDLDNRMSRQFYWLLGVQMTTFLATLAAILGVFYMRG